MQKIKAVFYHFNYYILPEDTTVDQLIGSVELQQLCTGDENLGSIPPYFIDSLIKTVTVDIDAPQHLAPCNVFVCDREEYDKILRKHVCEKCIGCKSYSNDPSDLSGHYVEMDLDGQCYLRRQAGDKIIFYDILYYIIGSKLECQFDKIKKCIDKGNDKKLSKIFNKHLTNVMFPVELFGRVQEGNYILYARACASVPEYALDVHFLSSVFNDMPSVFVKNGWKMVPCLKGGVVKYKGKTKLDNGSKVAYFTECGRDGQGELRIFIPQSIRNNPNKVKRYVDDIENYLTCALGEEMYHAWYNICAIESDIALTTLGEVVDAITRYYHKQPPVPFPKMFDIDLADGQNMSGTPMYNRDNILQLASNAPNLSTMTQEDLQHAGPPTLWLNHYTFGYVYVPNVADASVLFDDLLWYMDARNNPNVLLDKSNLTLVCGQSFCKNDGFMIDLLLPNKQRALHRFRSILPVLSKYHAQVSIVDESCQLDTYICGDTLQKIN